MLNHEWSLHGIKCTQWDCNFTTKGSIHNPDNLLILKEHIEVNHGYKCDKCEDGFKTKEELTEHINEEHSEPEGESESVN